MVSIGNNQRSPSGGVSFSNDRTQLFDETDEASIVSSVLISEEEPHFKIIPLTGVIIFEIICTIGLLTSAFVVPYYMKEDKCFVLNCLHASYWCLLFITSSFRNYHHVHLQRCGYLEFYRKTQLLQKIPLLIPSLGNALLLVCSSLFHKYCHDHQRCPTSSSMYCYSYLQVFFGIEVLILLPCLVKYAILVITFNRSKCSPDIHQDELISYSQSHGPVNEVGFRDEEYMDEILEKQADMIRYLKQHSSSLSRKIMKLTSQLDSLRNTIQ